MPTTSHGQILRQRGDITGRRYEAQVAAKGDRSVAIKHTMDSLNDGTPLTIMPERGGAAWAIPTHLVELIKAAIDRGDL